MAPVARFEPVILVAGQRARGAANQGMRPLPVVLRRAGELRNPWNLLTGPGRERPLLEGSGRSFRPGPAVEACEFEFAPARNLRANPRRASVLLRPVMRNLERELVSCARQLRESRRCAFGDGVSSATLGQGHRRQFFFVPRDGQLSLVCPAMPEEKGQRLAS